MLTVGKGNYEPINGANGEDVSASLLPSASSIFQRDLDTFFQDIYVYHQSGGFGALMLEELLWIVKLVFVVFIGIELTVCTRWEVITNRSVHIISWDKMFTPPDQCWSSLPVLPALLVTVAFTALLLQCGRALLRLQRFLQVRRFSTRVLGLPTSAIGLGDLTWSDVQKQLIDCHEFPELDEWGIYHRILRQENYLIAMIDQEVLPVRFKLSLSYPPLPYVYLSNGYLFNLKILLFWSRWSPFSRNSQLMFKYKAITQRHILATGLANLSRFLGFINLIFAPIILFAQVLIFVCSNAERLRYQPASVLGRQWSNYGKLYLRHYNELRHQFVSRVSRAYIPASQYLNSFTSRNVVVLAEAGAYIFGSLSAAFLVIGMFHDQMMHLPGYWFIVVCGGLLARACIAAIPDEHVVYSPKHLLVTVLGGIHRIREDWIQHSATYRVRCEFAELFQYRLSGLLEELVSPIITPFLLLFVVPNHTLAFVDFLRNYTVELHSIGDICSFAQLDVRRHGDPSWIQDTTKKPSPNTPGVPDVSAGDPAESTKQVSGGKTELSLMCFHLNNPSCQLPSASRALLLDIRNQLLKDLQQQPQNACLNQQDQTNSPPLMSPQRQVLSPVLFNSLYSLQGDGYNTVSQSGTYFHRPVPRLRNASVLPGPAYIQGDTLGFVGAMSESMRSSAHQSDPEMMQSAASVNTITKQITTAAVVSGDEAAANTVSSRPGSRAVHEPVAHGEGGYEVRQPTRPFPTGPINMSSMAASALFSTDGTGNLSYAPYISQTEDQSSQFWGVNSTVIANSLLGGRHTMSDLFTADTSASILYMHELAQRRRQHRLGQQNLLLCQPSHSYHQFGSGQVRPGGGVSSSSSYEPRLSMPAQPQSGSSAGTSSLPQRQTGVGNVTGSSATRLGGELTGAPSRNYGALASTQVPPQAGGDTPRFVRPAFAEVAEEEEEVFPIPSALQQNFYYTGYQTPERSSGTAGVVTVPGSSTFHHAPAQMSSRRLSTDHLTADIGQGQNTDHMWPDLPPTD